MALLALAGCGLHEGWTKPGASADEHRMAIYECERDRITARVGAWLFEQCMAAKGYTR